MKVILCEDVDNLGDMGDTVSVAPGYARNYLLPRKLAVVADSASAKRIEHEMRIIKKREAKRREGLAEVARTLDAVQVVFKAKAGAEGKLFGSITTLHIAERLHELGHPVNRRKIQLADPIKFLGEHDIVVRLASGIDAMLKVIVEAEESEEPPAQSSEPTATEAEVQETKGLESTTPKEPIPGSLGNETEKELTESGASPQTAQEGQAETIGGESG